MLKSEARKVLGETAITWPHLAAKAQRRFWDMDFTDIEKDAIRILHGAPKWETPEPEPEAEGDEPQAVTVDLATAVAIAKRYGVSRDELLAAVGLGEVEGIAPGSKELCPEALVAWLDSLVEVIDEPLEDDALEDMPVAVAYEPPQLTWWQANGLALLYLLGTVLCYAFVVLCFVME